MEKISADTEARPELKIAAEEKPESEAEAAAAEKPEPIVAPSKKARGTVRKKKSS